MKSCNGFRADVILAVDSARRLGRIEEELRGKVCSKKEASVGMNLVTA